MIIAVALWVYILFKILYTEENLLGTPKKKVRTLDTATAKYEDTDSFLLLNYRDPFLGDAKLPKTTRSIQKRAKQPTTFPKTIWPSILYLGGISYSKTSAIAFLNIAQKEVLLEQGKTYMDITLLKVFTDSVYLSYKGDKKYIKIML